MSFFTVGNLLTLGIVVLGFILYHQLTRKNRTLDKIREYGKRLKEDLAAFVEEKGQDIHDFAVSLDVEKQSARELLKRLVITDQELADKAEAVARIDERLNGYDVSLEELVRMTNRVQENLNRLHAESGFVESVARRVSASDERLKGAEEKLKAVEKDLADIELCFERENAGSLERTAEAIIASVNSTVLDLQAAAELVERQVEEHREEINRVEEQRSANINRDIERINTTLSAALEEAASRADTLEDTALAKFRDQALERAQRYQTVVEDKLKAWQDSAKARAEEVQELVKTCKEEWKADYAEMEAKRQAGVEAWKQDLDEFERLVRTRRDDWDAAVEAGARENRDLIAELENRVRELQDRIDARTAQVETLFTEAVEEARIAAAGELESWQKAAAEEQAARKTAAAEELESWQKAAAKDLAARKTAAEGDLAALESAVAAALEARKQNMDEFERLIRIRRDDWDAAVEAGARENRDLIAELENRVRELQDRIDARTAQVETLFTEAVEEARIAAAGELESWQKAAAEEQAARKTAAAGELESWQKAAAEDLAARKTAAAGELESWQKAAAEDLAARKTAAAGELESWQKAAAEDLAARKTAAAGELESWQKAAAEDLAARKTAAEGDLAALESAAAAALEAWKQNMAEFERLVRIRRDDWDMAVEAKTRENRELIAEMENRVRELQNLVDARTAQVEAVFTEIMEQSEIKARTASATELDAWKSASAAELDSLKSAFAMEFDIRKTANDREHERWKNTAEADYLRWQESVLEEENRTRRLLTELEASSEDLKGRITGEFSVLEAKLRDFTGHSAEVVAGLERRLVDTADDMEQRVLETTEKRLEEYRQIQAEQYRRLETMAEDTGKLDAELRSYMADTEKRVEDDFALFERDAAARRNEVAAVFEGSVKALRDDMAGVERELASLKERAYENVSEKLRLFEDDFTADLSRRKGDIGVRLEEWKLALDRDLGLLGEQAGEERRRLELAFSEELKRRVAERQAELASALERLKVETGVFEDEIRNQISQAEETLAGYREQLNGDLEEARTGAETSVRAEIRQYALTTAETLKQAQRELAASLREIEEQVETRNAGVSELQESSRREIEEWQAKLAAQIRDADGILDDVRRRVRELVTESDERVASVRSAIEDVYTEADSRRVEVFAHTGEQVKLLDSAIKDADRHIREFIRETKLFEQTDALKLELQRRIEDFRSDLDHLDQRRSEAAELETQFIKIKRLEDDINNKMTRFLSEQRRIDRMEEAFNRLLLTSQGVEEKLSQVTASDDTLQAIQVQIRKLTDALDDTEERYQRIEKKNKTLETTTEGIDRNFKALDEAGAGLKRFEDELYRLSQEQDNLRQGIEKLAADSDKARMAAEKLSLLDTELSAIEKRIGDIQIAREWLARTVTQMEELDKEIQNRIKMAGNLAKDTLGKGPPKSKGAPPMATRDSAVKLARQGWTVDEIAAALKISRAEVELIIEMGPKD